MKKAETKMDIFQIFLRIYFCWEKWKLELENFFVNSFENSIDLVHLHSFSIHAHFLEHGILELHRKHGSDLFYNFC